MSLYLDTSLLVAALTSERATPRVHAWLSKNSRADLTISDWVTAEFSAALSVKLRTRGIEAAARANALARFARLCNVNLTVVPVSRSAFTIAAHFADQSAVGLRAGDALHLAICAELAATICTLDRRLAEAAQDAGVATDYV